MYYDIKTLICLFYFVMQLFTDDYRTKKKNVPMTFLIHPMHAMGQPFEPRRKEPGFLHMRKQI